MFCYDYRRWRRVFWRAPNNGIHATQGDCVVSLMLMRCFRLYNYRYLCVQMIERERCRKSERERGREREREKETERKRMCALNFNTVYNSLRDRAVYVK